jgi:hypothetical protein
MLHAGQMEPSKSHLVSQLHATQQVLQIQLVMKARIPLQDKRKIPFLLHVKRVTHATVIHVKRSAPLPAEAWYCPRAFQMRAQPPRLQIPTNQTLE